MNVRELTGLYLVLALVLTGYSKPAPEKMELRRWDRGIQVRSRSDPSLFAYLWFYEWTLFDAVRPGEHTSGNADWEWRVDSAGSYAKAESEWFTLTATAVEDGARLELEVTNTTGRAWPDIAAIIPCFNPGYDKRQRTDAVANRKFFDDTHDHTYFLAESGLDLLAGEAPREIHFTQALLPSIQAWEKEREDGQFAWYHKWPTSSRDAVAGALVRESEDRSQVMAIAWERFLSAQGHNPWKCMHLSVRLGPLQPGESRTVRGKIYLFDGNKADFMAKLEKDFPSVSAKQENEN